MNILLTGASSFTGYWFARTLALRGHTVYATFQGPESSYEGARGRRVKELPSGVNCLWEAALNSQTLLDSVASVPHWDLLCLHGAFVTGYRERGFDVAGALRNNTEGLPRLLEQMAARGLKRVVATGSVFEADEGAGEEPRRAFSPYGLSKSVTWQVQRYWTQDLGLHLGKFLVPNPFGPFEEPRFTAYLMKTWYAGKTAEVRTPLYIRDNIHVSQLALHYAHFAEGLPASPGTSHCAPMGYVESQGVFTQRFASEMRTRLGIECGVALGQQTDFGEPLMRVNTQRLALAKDEWNETSAWDELAGYYRAEFAPAG
jgi:nucleoside-diphosphate-sugar epimerase